MAMVVALVMAIATPWAAVAAGGCFVAVMALNWRYYRWFARTRGLLFALRVVPVHLVHHICNAVSFVAGAALHIAARWGWTLPATLPARVWTAEAGLLDERPPLRRST